jgi:hypothetical protein
MNIFSSAMALALLAIPSIADAKTDWAKQKLDPALAYVLVQIEPIEFKMMGNNQIATGIILASYEPDKARIKLIEKDGKIVGVARLALGKTPVAKDGKRRQYFAAISPGSWVIEGSGGEAPTLGAPATSFSLGSYRFEAQAGQVIDLGVIAPKREESDNPDTKMSTGKMAGMIFAGPFGGGRVEPLPLKLDIRARLSGDIPLPVWLATTALTQPAFTYGATFANLLGGLVNRVDGKAGRGRTPGEIAYLTKTTP